MKTTTTNIDTMLTSEETLNLGAPSDNYKSIFRPLTESEKETVKGLENEPFNLLVSVNGDVKTVRLLVDNYSGFVLKSEFDDLCHSVRCVGVKEPVQIQLVAGESEVYAIYSGNHRTGAHVISGTSAPLPVVILDGVYTNDLKYRSMFHLEQAVLNKRVTRDSKDLIKLATNCFKAGISIKEISAKTGVSISHIQSYLVISGKSANVLASLGFDLITNPFKVSELTKVVDLQRFATKNLWVECLEDVGKSKATGKFILELGKMKLKEEDSLRESGLVSQVNGELVGSEEKVVSVPTMTAVVDEKTGKKSLKNGTKDIIVGKKEVVITFMAHAVKMYNDLNDLAVAYEDSRAELLSIIAESFKVQ